MKRASMPTFFLELPLRTDSVQSHHLRAHLEAARCLSNAVLSEANSRLRRMRCDPAWHAACALPRARKQQRRAAFAHLRKTYQFSEYALHASTTHARCSWIAEHVDSTMAQTLATRAYHAVNRVCLNQRFRSKGRGMNCVEGKRNDTGLRFVLSAPEQGQDGWLLWGSERICALIDWQDPVMHHGLSHRITYVRLLRRRASSTQAQGADCTGHRYAVQLALEGLPYQKPKQQAGKDIVGLDIGPSTLAVVSHEHDARLLTFCEELAPNARKRRRLQRHMERQRRANNPQHYDAAGRIKKTGQRRLRWKERKRYQRVRNRHATTERKLAAQRKSLHGKLAHEIVRMGSTIAIEKTSYTGWQKRYGTSVGLRAPGMFVAQLKRTVAKTGGTLREVPTGVSKLSQYCHGCKQ